MPRPAQRLRQVKHELEQMIRPYPDECRDEDNMEQNKEIENGLPNPVEALVAVQSSFGAFAGMVEAPLRPAGLGIRRHRMPGDKGDGGRV